MEKNKEELEIDNFSEKDWDMLYKFNKVLEINANKYGKENAILTFMEYFNSGRTENFTREEHSRTLIEELDKDKLYELLKDIFAIDSTKEIVENAFEIIMEEKKTALNNASAITYDKYEKERGIGGAQLEGALKKLWESDNYNLFTNEHNIRETLKRTVSSKDLILLMGYILEDDDLLNKGNTIKDSVDMDRIITIYVYEIEKMVKDLRTS